MDNKITRKKLDDMCTKYLNGDWKRFEDSLEDIREDINELSDEEIKAKRKALILKLMGGKNAA